MIRLMLRRGMKNLWKLDIKIFSASSWDNIILRQARIEVRIELEQPHAEGVEKFLLQILATSRKYQYKHFFINEKG